MRVTVNKKLIAWPSEWPPPSKGMVLYDAGQSLEVISVTWVLPDFVDRGPDSKSRFMMSEPAVLVDAQPTFYQVTQDEMQDKLKV